VGAYWKRLDAGTVASGALRVRVRSWFHACGFVRDLCVRSRLVDLSGRLVTIGAW
jgi:hypothetical protein